MKLLIIRAIVKLISKFPFYAARWLGRQLGRGLYWSRSRSYRTTLRNLEHCELPFTEAQKTQLAYRSCLHTGSVVLESLWIWQQPYSKVSPLIHRVEGQAHIAQALAQGQGVILTGLHMGNWELISLWTATLFPTVGMYRPAKQAFLNDLITTGRTRTGTELISGERKNARKLLGVLRDNKVLLVLADQEPEKGSGVYVPFFGKPAYTMTLPFRLAEKTGATVLFFQVMRTAKGFEIIISKPALAATRNDATAFCSSLNQEIETRIMQAPDQFEWGYKRFKSPPDGDYDFYPE